MRPFPHIAKDCRDIASALKNLSQGGRPRSGVPSAKQCADLFREAANAIDALNADYCKMRDEASRLNNPE